MRVDVRFVNTPRSSVMSEFVKCHARVTLEAFHSSIRYVVVRFAHEGHGAEPAEKCCSIVVVGSFGRRQVTERGENWFELSARAVQRAHREVTPAVLLRGHVEHMTIGLLGARTRTYLS